MKHTHASAIMVAASLAAGNLFAATSTTTFEVSLDFENTCRVAVTDMAFGLRSHLLTQYVTSADGVVACSSTVPVTVTFNEGTGTGSTFAMRTMSHPTAADTIEYNLYDDTTYTNVLGDGVTGGTVAIAFTGPGTFTIYGRTEIATIPKPVGLYSSTITATVTF